MCTVYWKASLPASQLCVRLRWSKANSQLPGPLLSEFSLVFTYMHITLAARLDTQSKPHGHGFASSLWSSSLRALVNKLNSGCMNGTWNVRDMEAWKDALSSEMKNYCNSGALWKCNLANSEDNLLLLENSETYSWMLVRNLLLVTWSLGILKIFWHRQWTHHQASRHFIRYPGGYSTHLQTPRRERMRWHEVSTVVKFRCANQDSKSTTNLI